MKTVFINLQKDEIKSSQEIPINCIIKIDSSFVDMGQYLNKNELGALILFEHHQIITTLNLTEVTPYVLLFFDANLIFKGASYSLKSGIGRFTLETQYKTILFLRLPHNLKLNTIINLSHDSY
ncbi:hypothetical protein [Psychroserpens jangbogonensis]|uniref:hypothetical protein n=1 Tax=Psychroserpens jangbogonensis TaxID=1484460 RepID=UPI00053D60C7|nr:hypothetical protein [Psychroserpens jangbogonensis]